MSVYFIAGSPYSDDELYHYGIKGQKWGVRRFQNEDRTWTAAGKIRYGAQKAAEAVSRATSRVAKAAGRGAKAVAKHKIDNFKSRHPWMMSEQELNERMRRVNMERSYQQALRDTKQISNARRIVGNILENGGRTIANAAFNKLANQLVKTKLEKENDRLQNEVRNRELKERLSSDNIDRENERLQAEVRNKELKDRLNVDDLERENTKLQNQVRNKELKEKLAPSRKVSDVMEARSVISNPKDHSAQDVQDARNILQNLSQGKLFAKNYFGDSWDNSKSYYDPDVDYGSYI